MCAEVLAQRLHRVGQAPQFATDLPQSLAEARLTLAEMDDLVADLPDVATQVVAEQADLAS